MAENTNTGNWVTEAVTPYKLAQFLSAALSEALDMEVTIAPQQIYGAVRSGTLEVSRFDSGHMKVTPAKANAFIQARIDRQLKSDEDEAAEEQEEVGAES